MSQHYVEEQVIARVTYASDVSNQDGKQEKVVGNQEEEGEGENKNKHQVYKEEELQITQTVDIINVNIYVHVAEHEACVFRSNIP